MSLQTQLEAEKRALRAEILRLDRIIGAEFERTHKEARLFRTDSFEAYQAHMDAIYFHLSCVKRHYGERIHYLECRLLDLETTEIRGGLWYKTCPAPGEARLILERSLSQGMADAAAPGETRRSSPRPASL